MDHFSVVQSIIRSGLGGDQAGLEKQVQRLLTRLEKAGQQKEAVTIRRLLSSSAEIREIAPSRVEVSRSIVTGEGLLWIRTLRWIGRLALSYAPLSFPGS